MRRRSVRGAERAWQDLAIAGERDSGTATLLVVDDDADLRSLVQATVTLARDFRVVGEAADGASAVQLATRLQPDIVVLDLGLPDLPGLDVLAELMRVSPQSRVVVFSGLDESGTRSAALAGGAASYVMKGTDIAVLVRALRDLRPPPTDRARASFAPTPDSAVRARQFIRDFCERGSCIELIESAELIASELITNAVVHAKTACLLTIELNDESLRMEATDDSPDAPAPIDVTEDAESGRGLFIIAALSTAWGVDPTPIGKSVWAELRRGDLGAHP